MNNYYINILKLKVLYHIRFYKFPTSELKQYRVWPNQISHETNNHTELGLKIKWLKKYWNFIMSNRKKHTPKGMEPENYFLEQNKNTIRIKI